MYIFAVASSMVYLPQETRADYLRKYSKEWVLDSRFQTPDTSVIVNKHTGLAIFAVRGTDFSLVRDVVQDIGIAFNKKELITRLNQDDAVLKKSLEKYNKNIIITGHSLGGYIGVWLALKHNLHGKFFNIGASPADQQSLHSTKIIHYTTNNLIDKVVDPLSITAVLRDRFKLVVVRQKVHRDPHTIRNFLP